MISTATNVASYDSELAGKIIRDALQFSDFGIARESIDGISSQHVLSLYPEMNSFDARVAAPFSSRLNKLLCLASEEYLSIFGLVDSNNLENTRSEFYKFFDHKITPENQSLLESNPALSVLRWFYLNCTSLYIEDSAGSDRTEEGIQIIDNKTVVMPWAVVLSDKALWEKEGYDASTYKQPRLSSDIPENFFLEMYKAPVRLQMFTSNTPVGKSLLTLLNFMIHTAALAHLVDSDGLEQLYKTKRTQLLARLRPCSFGRDNLYDNARDSLQLYFDFSAKIDALPDPEMRVA